MMVPVVHRLCGKPAFLYEQDQIKIGAVVLSKFARHLDGAPIEALTTPICDSCGRGVAFDRACLGVPYATDGD